MASDYDMFAQRFAIDEVISFATMIATQHKVADFTSGKLPCKCAQLFAREHAQEVERAIIICAAYFTRIYDEILARIRDGLPLHNTTPELGPAPEIRDQYSDFELIDEAMRILLIIPSWCAIERSLATLVIA